MIPKSRNWSGKNGTTMGDTHPPGRLSLLRELLFKIEQIRDLAVPNRACGACDILAGETFSGN
jgi:hypothetical protein